MVHQVNALGATIHQCDIVREPVVLVQLFDGAHAESFIRPEDISYAEYKCLIFHKASRFGDKLLTYITYLFNNVNKIFDILGVELFPVVKQVTTLARNVISGCTDVIAR